MNLSSRIQKLEVKLGIKRKKIYFIGWANCEWNESDGLLRRRSESKEEFCRRVSQNTNKKYLWFK